MTQLKVGGIVEQTGGRSVLRLGTRESRLALWQARHVADRLAANDVAVEIVPIGTSGDRDLSRPIASLPSDSPFADDIEAALRAGEIDLAVHSLKDLSVRPVAGLTIAAVLKRGDPAETLVSRDNLTLEELPPGASVGTSSPRRAAQIMRLRPDLRPVPIRGAVEDRVRQVREGRFDAAILAAAGLERLELSHEAVQRFDLRAFVPAPGQATLAVQTRMDDAAVIASVSMLEHEPTRRANAAELEFLRPFEEDTSIAVAAYAVARASVQLHAQVLSPDGHVLFDQTRAGDDPRVVARAMAYAFERQQSSAGVRT